MQRTRQQVSLDSFNERRPTATRDARPARKSLRRRSPFSLASPLTLRTWAQNAKAYEFCSLYTCSPDRTKQKGTRTEQSELTPQKIYLNAPTSDFLLIRI